MADATDKTEKEIKDLAIVPYIYFKENKDLYKRLAVILEQKKQIHNITKDEISESKKYVSNEKYNEQSILKTPLKIDDIEMESIEKKPSTCLLGKRKERDKDSKVKISLPENKKTKNITDPKDIDQIKKLALEHDGYDEVFKYAYSKGIKKNTAKNIAYKARKEAGAIIKTKNITDPKNVDQIKNLALKHDGYDEIIEYADYKGIKKRTVYSIARKARKEDGKKSEHKIK